MSKTRAPEGLGAAGKKAWARALRAIDTADDPDLSADMAARYAQQVDLADKARREWRKHGEPLTLTQVNKAIGPHPLLKVIENADKLAHWLSNDLGIKSQKRKHRGPDPRAVIQPGGVGESPAAKLRVVPPPGL
jgi:phage terminase small subunit